MKTHSSWNSKALPAASVSPSPHLSTTRRRSPPEIQTNTNYKNEKIPEIQTNTNYKYEKIQQGNQITKGRKNQSLHRRIFQQLAPLLLLIHQNCLKTIGTICHLHLQPGPKILHNTHNFFQNKTSPFPKMKKKHQPVHFPGKLFATSHSLFLYDNFPNTHKIKTKTPFPKVRNLQPVQLPGKLLATSHSLRSLLATQTEHPVAPTINQSIFLHF